MEAHTTKQAQNPVLKHTKQIAIFAAIAPLLGASFATPPLAVTVTQVSELQGSRESTGVGVLVSHID